LIAREREKKDNSILGTQRGKGIFEERGEGGPGERPRLANDNAGKPRPGGNRKRGCCFSEKTDDQSRGVKGKKRGKGEKCQNACP